MNAQMFAKHTYHRLLTNQKASKEVEVVFDPITISLIASIVIEVVKLLKGCKRNEDDVVRTVQSPNIIERRVLRRIVRKKLGIRRYIREGTPIYNAVLQQASRTNSNEVRVIYRGS
jgi:hypothetical protein